MTDFAIELAGISKRFGAVQANRDVMHIAKGSIHGIIGENGAGKSTLMSILYGYYQADSGSIRVSGREGRIRNSQEAIRLGIGMVHQHFMLVDTFTVLENIVLGAEGGLLLKQGMEQARAHLLQLNRDYSLEVDGRPGGRAGRECSSGGNPQGAVSRCRCADSGRAHRGADTAGGRSSVLHPACAARAGQDGHPDHPQAAEVMDITDAVSVMRAGTVVGNVRTADVDKENWPT
jgi:simple sugar transport system ATP-binding protein